MLQTINSQIQNINDSLAWIKRNRPAEYEQRFLQLVEERRRLKTLLIAAEDNPAVAAFGKSQVGKSYLMSCILQDKGKPFTVTANGVAYDFIENINPIGGDQEATGVVTRFSSFSKDPKRYSDQYPVLMRTLSVKDLILILADSYHLDITNFVDYGETELKDLTNSFYNKYINMPELSVQVLTADDILDMKRYFTKHINPAQTINRSTFMEKLAFVVNRIPVADYANVFGTLWTHNEQFTSLFSKILDILSRLEFSKYVYLPVEAVVHNGQKENTVMSVECLKLLLNPENDNDTDAYLKKGDSYTKVGNFKKAELCAVCSEVDFKIGEQFLHSTNSYSTEDVSEHTRMMLTKGNIEMAILADNDLLDFPGARSRGEENINKLSEVTVKLNCLLRGKVAYLFNRYNEALSINVLLYCHHNKDNDVTYLYQLIEDWINTYVGDTPEARKATIDKTEISPFFYIGTMFNVDMELKENSIANNEMSISQRWKGRFETVLFKGCFNRDAVDWVKNWTAYGSFFKNSFVLRDFKYSGPNSSKIYAGFREVQKETSMIIDRDYYNTMKRTFVDNPIVGELFEDPELSWDVAASINNDGALYIIEKLAIVAKNMMKAREKQFNDILKSVRANVKKAIVNYYISTDSDEILKANIRKAKSIFRELDFTCNTDNYYFGHLLQALQINETQCYRVIHDIMRGPLLNQSTNDFRNYEIIRNSCARFGLSLENCHNEAEQWDAVMKVYSIDSQEEAQDYLRRKGVDSKVLFSGNFRTKLNSCVIADNVFNAWCDSIRSVDFMTVFTGDDTFDGVVMTSLVDNIIETAKHYHLNDKLAEMIAEYVNVIDVHKANESLLADMMAQKISDFVLDFGYSELNQDEVSALKRLAEVRSLPIFKSIDKTTPGEYSESALTQLFNEMSTNPKALMPSFEENYNKWVEYMFISFIAHLDIPDFDPEQNEAIGNIINNL